MSEPRSNATPKRAWKKRGLALFLVFLAGAGLAVWVMGVFDQEPRYQGTPASEWLRQWAMVPDANAEKAFQAMGSTAVPFLVRVLKSKPSHLEQKLSDWAGKFNLPHWLVRRLPDPSERERLRVGAATMLRNCGPGARSAIPMLARLFKNPSESDEMQIAAGMTLESMGEAAIIILPELVENLTNPSERVQNVSAAILGNIGPKAQPAVPALKEAAESPRYLSFCAAEALWKINRETNIAVRVFSRRVTSANGYVRPIGLGQLAAMGTAAKAAVPAVEEALHDEDRDVREAAMNALKQIDPDRAQEALQSVNREVSTSLSKLIETIRSGSFKDSFSALEAIAVVGPEARAAVPVLIEKLNQSSLTNLPGHVAKSTLSSTALLNVRRNAAEALAEIGPEARAAVPALVGVLRQRGDYYLDPYFRALGRIGPDASDAIPALKEILQDGNPGARLAAARALAKIDPREARVFLPVLTEFQKDSQPRFHLSASVALWELKLEADSPVPALMELLKQPGEAYTTTELLGDLGPAARESIPSLEKVLRHESISYRRRAANAIRKIDPEAWDRIGLPGTLALP